MYKRSDAKRWQRDAFLLIYSKVKENPFFDKQVNVECHLYLKRDRDIDSSFKLLCDTLENAKVIKNDKQIRRLSAEKYKSKDPKLVVVISEYVDSTAGENN